MLMTMVMILTTIMTVLKKSCVELRNTQRISEENTRNQCHKFLIIALEKDKWSAYATGGFTPVVFEQESRWESQAC
jgi:hypothetical protein